MVENVANMAASLLPVSQKFINGVPVPQGRKTLRLKEKYIILLVFVTFGLVCFGAFFFLPDLRDRVRLNDVKNRIRNVNEMIIPRGGIKGGEVIRHDVDDHKHLNEDVIKFQNQMQRDLAREGRVVEMGKKLNISKKDVVNIKDEIDSEKDKMMKIRKEEEKKKAENEKEKAIKVEMEHAGGEGGQGGEPSDPDVGKKREKVREVREGYMQDSF